MAPGIAVGVSISAAPALPAVTTTPEVAGASTTTVVPTIAAPPPKNAESVFLEKNSSIRSLLFLASASRITMVLLLLIWMRTHGLVFPLQRDHRGKTWLRRFFADMLVKTYQTGQI
jgi:hypothetical protein